MSIARGSRMIAGNAMIINSEAMCNPNLLINSNFRINTSGFDSYTTPNKETVNKWTAVVSDPDTVTFEANPVANGIQLICRGPAESFVYLIQKLSVPIGVNKYFTCTVKTGGNEAISAEYLREAGVNNFLFDEDGKLRAVYYDATDEFAIRAYAGETITFNWAKVEFGENQTMYVDPDPALELVRVNTNASSTEVFDSTTSKPNLLINPDFRINQRAAQDEHHETYYDHTGYTVDRWYTNGCKLRLPATIIDQLKLTFGTGGIFKQYVEYLRAGVYTLSVQMTGNTSAITLEAGEVATKVCGNGMTILTFTLPENTANFGVCLKAAEATEVYIDYIKLEAGNSASVFTPADISQELLRCQRYYQILTDNHVDHHNLRPTMRAVPTTSVVIGGFEYDAEIYALTDGATTDSGITIGTGEDSNTNSSGTTDAGASTGTDSGDGTSLDGDGESVADEESDFNF